MVDISTNSEGAELFHEVSKKRRWIHVMAKVPGWRGLTIHGYSFESTCMRSGHMPNTLGTATIAFIHMAKSFYFYQIVISRPWSFKGLHMASSHDWDIHGSVNLSPVSDFMPTQSQIRHFRYCCHPWSHCPILLWQGTSPSGDTFRMACVRTPYW